MDLDSEAGWTNAAANGVRKRFNWNEIESKAGVYDWSQVDAAIASAAKNGKQTGLSVVMLATETGHTPTTWPSDLKATTYDLPETPSGHGRTVILPWDGLVLPRLVAFMKALCLHVDGKIDYLAMGGLGVVIESYITPDPEAALGLELPDAIAKWTSSCNAIIQVHADNLKSTVFIFTAATPYDGADSKTALDSVVRAAAAKYPHRFGVMDCSLLANSNTGYLPNKLVSDLSATNPTGLQFVTSSQGFGGHDLGGTLQQCMDAAVALKAHYVEVYPLDLNDSVNAAMFQSYMIKLAK